MIINDKECSYCFQRCEIHYERDEDEFYQLEPPYCPFCGHPDPDMELPEIEDEE